MSIAPSISAAELVDRFLARVDGLSLSQAGALWGVSPSYISKLREGSRPERMQQATRRALAEVVERLEAESVAGAELTHGSAFDAGYAAAVFDSIAADARHILTKAEAARDRIAAARAAPGNAPVTKSAQPLPTPAQVFGVRGRRRHGGAK